MPAIDGDLPDDFIKTLIEQLLPNGAEPDLPRLLIDQSLLELLVQLDHFDFGGRRGEDGLNPQLPIIGAVLLGWQYLAEDVLGMVLLLLLLALTLPALRGPAHQNRRRVFHQGTLLA